VENLLTLQDDCLEAARRRRPFRIGWRLNEDLVDVCRVGIELERVLRNGVVVIIIRF
jgi:hypothetical protein